MESTKIIDVPEIYMKTVLLPHQVEAVAWMKEKENTKDDQFPKKQKGGGGLLADDMGLGKTVTCISLIVASINNNKTIDFGDNNLNLIIVPLSLLVQWKIQLTSHTNLVESQILIYYGKDRKELFQKFCEEKQGYIVITTYEIVRSEFFQPKTRLKPLFETDWHRILLDEAHRIRAKDNNTANSVFRLKSKYRWCVTGTPFNNNIEDLISLCQFINIAPYNKAIWWNSKKANVSIINQWVKNFVLMRTKKILSLPPITKETIWINFDPVERNFYSKNFEQAISVYRKFKSESNPFQKCKMFGGILGWFIKLRQICCHPLLLLQRTTTRYFSTKSMAGFKTPKLICVKCRKELCEKASSTLKINCGHYICSNCESIVLMLDELKCNLCRDLEYWFSNNAEDQIAPPIKYNLRKRKQIQLDPSNLGYKFKPNSKCIAILDFCKKRLSENDTNKIVLFSQSTAFLDIIEHLLERNNINILRYDGDILKTEERNDIIVLFQKEETNRILLCSLQCGGVGLNLTNANTVVLADIGYNPSLEKQAIDRVHRIGQTSPVLVAKFIVQDSIESEVWKIQERKISEAERLFSDMVPKEFDTSQRINENKNPTLTENDVHCIFKKLSKEIPQYRTYKVDDPNCQSSKKIKIE